MKDFGKWKREDGEDVECFMERRGRFIGCGGDLKREWFLEFYSCGRVSFLVWGWGMVGIVMSYWGCGRGDRGNRDIRDYKEYKLMRLCEFRFFLVWKMIKDE